MIEESSVFFQLVERVLHRVYNNDVKGVELRRTPTEKTALALMKNLYKPDIVITSSRLRSTTFDRNFTLYPLDKDNSFNQDRLAKELRACIAVKYPFEVPCEA